MTGQERVLATFKHLIPDRVPYDIWEFNREALRLFQEKTGLDDPDKYFGVEKDIVWIGFEETRLNLKERFSKYHHHTAGSNFTLNEWGTGFEVGSNPAYDRFIAPLTEIKSIEEIKNYPLPDFTSDYRHKHLKEEIKKIKDKGLASVAGLYYGTIFEVAWQVRGFNELLTDLMSHEDLATCLLDRITELRIFQVRRFAEADIDIIFIADDVGMEDRLMMSPDTWRKWLKPRLAKVIRSAREIKPGVVFSYHSDGYVEPIIPDFIEIGIDVLNPVQPECMDPAKLKKLYGDKLAFWGTIGVQHTLPFGTPEDVADEVKMRIETIGRNGGLYLSPNHVIAPEVPYENIFAMVEFAKKYGRY